MLDCGYDILGGPEIYNVPSKAFTAGLPGNRTENTLAVKLEVGGLVAALWRLSSSMRGHCYMMSNAVNQISIVACARTKTASSISDALICPTYDVEKLFAELASAET